MRWTKRRKRLAIAALVLASPLAVAVVRTLALSSRQPSVAKLEDAPVDAEPVARALAEAVRCKTVSLAESEAELAKLHAALAAAFPRAHQALKREVIDGRSLLFTWPGTEKAEKPIVLLSHLDVVPVEEGTEKDWEHPAFGGDIADGFVWGRGTLDDKAGVIGILAAVERLATSGFSPKRTLYLAFGHDEEVGGKGAVGLARLLASRGVHAELVLDEGGSITQGIVPGVKAPVAVVGIAEKGYLTVDLSVAVPGGHSSMPSKETSVTALARAVRRLDETPMPASLDGPMGEFAAHIAPEMPFGMRLAFSNPWLTKPLLLRALAGASSTNASIRTTTAVTMFHGGVKDNVLPASASAVVNFRILPGDSVASVLAHVRRAIDDPRVEVRPRREGASEPSRQSSTTSFGYQLIARTIREIFPEVVVAPVLVLGATDGRHYVDVADDVYRFLPITLEGSDLERIHGKNERARVSDLGHAVRFYRRLIESATGAR